MGIQILDMDLRTIIVGLAIGVLIGTGGMYAVNLSKVSQLNKQIDALDTQVEQLNDVISNQQTLIDSQNEEIQAVDALEDEIQAKDTLIAEYEKLIDMLVEKYSKVNHMCARQTYRAEKALHLLQDYLPDYEPEYEPIVDLRLTFGNFTFTEWWELYGGPFEEWYGLIYP